MNLPTDKVSTVRPAKVDANHLAKVGSALLKWWRAMTL